MAEKRRFLDVWIVESNTVYREVPYEVVSDWIQQGRLLADDMLRWSGKADWFKLGSAPIFAAYMPQVETFAAEDQAEALEPVEMGFSWKRRSEEEEDDVDMIPLIDVSLVLLIFFMMTGTVAVGQAFFDIPLAQHGNVSITRDFWVGIKADDQGNPKEFSIGQGDKKANSAKDWETFLPILKETIDNLPRRVEVTIDADRQLKSGHVRRMLVELEKRRDRLTNKYFGVREGPR
jgi:biopolymer transport protein ExbD